MQGRTSICIFEGIMKKELFVNIFACQRNVALSTKHRGKCLLCYPEDLK